MLRYLLSFALLSFSSFSFALDYFWHWGLASNPHFSSPTAACDAYFSTLTPTGGTSLYYIKVDGITNVSSMFAKCNVSEYRKIDNGRVADLSTWLSRGGDSCPPGATYDAATGECVGPEPDPCESKAGQTSYHEHQVGTLDNPDAPHTPPPGSVCENKCQLAFSGSAPTDCYRYADGTKLNAAFCKYQYKYNGISCTDADTSTPDIFDQPPTKPPIDQKPLLTNATNCNDWVTNSDGSRTRNCTANETFKQPGTMSCSTSGAALKCTAGTPAPAYSEKDTTQQTTETANADGSTSTSTTTTTDKTTCYGTKPCTSTSKTETDTGGTKPDGTPGDSSHTCTGDNCTKDDSKDDPAKDPEEGEEEEGSKVAGESCDSELSCTGDAIQCAILRKQKEQACQWDYEKAKPGIESAIAGSEYQLQESEHDVSGLFNNALNAARWLPSACPPPQRYSLSTGNGISGEFSWQPTCDFASGVAPFLVAGACLFFAVYVGRGIGS